MELLYNMIENNYTNESEKISAQCKEKGICTSVGNYAKTCLNTYRLGMYLELKKIRELYLDFCNSPFNTFTEYAQANNIGVEELNEKLSLGRLLDK